MRKGFTFIGYKSPMAVVVVSPGGKCALSPDGQAVATRAAY
ncbi:MAG: hypothetical protein V1823_00665 [Chloroflexota bacterium]